MSNHFSAANLKHPGDDARLDLTDLFVFAAPDDPDRTVLIMDANPFTKGNGFHPDAVYRFNIDNDGDALADVAFSFTFSEPQDGRQAAAYYATGNEAQTREPRGEMLIEDAAVGLQRKRPPALGLPDLVAHPGRGRERDLRLHRRLVQHPPHPGRPRRSQPRRVRGRLVRR
jgi:hypothetical protein